MIEVLFWHAVFWFSVLAIVWPYLGYPLALRLLPAPPEPPPVPSHEPSVSVIVAAYNEEAVIERRVANLLALDYPPEKLEIIIVSDGSTDRTNALVPASERVTLLAFEERRGKVNALNDAVPRARGEIIVFSDANTDFAPDAVRRLAARFADPAVGCVCGKLVFRSSAGSTTGEMEGAYWRLESRLKREEGLRGSLLGANGANYALRRELWTGCPPGTIIEDFVIPMRILEQGKKVVFEETAQAFEEAGMHLDDEFQRRVRIGAGDYQALSLLWPMLSPVRGFTAFAFLSRKVLRWLAPFFMILAFLANFRLAVGSLHYAVLFLGQCGVYGLAVLGLLRPETHPLARQAGYFLAMNAALALGFIRFLTGRQTVKWQRTARSQTPA